MWKNKVKDLEDQIAALFESISQMEKKLESIKVTTSISRDDGSSTLVPDTTNVPITNEDYEQTTFEHHGEVHATTTKIETTEKATTVQKIDAFEVLTTSENCGVVYKGKCFQLFVNEKTGINFRDAQLIATKLEQAWQTYMTLHIIICYKAMHARWFPPRYLESAHGQE
ncbi:uncharacterized protein LOC120334113 isoform X2 [Styela clava]